MIHARLIMSRLMAKLRPEVVPWWRFILDKLSCCRFHVSLRWWSVMFAFTGICPSFSISMIMRDKQLLARKEKLHVHTFLLLSDFSVRKFDSAQLWYLLVCTRLLAEIFFLLSFNLHDIWLMILVQQFYVTCRILRCCCQQGLKIMSLVHKVISRIYCVTNPRKTAPRCTK